MFTDHHNSSPLKQGQTPSHTEAVWWMKLQKSVENMWVKTG